MRDPLHFLPIRIKLPLAFLLIGLVALGAGGFLLARASTAVVAEQIDVLLAERADAAAVLVTGELGVLGRRIEDFASDGFIRTGLAGLGAGAAPENREALLRHLGENKLPLVPAFQAARLLDAAGRTALATDAWPGTNTPPDAPTSFGDFFPGPAPAAGPCFTLSTPVFAIRGGGRLGRLEILVSAPLFRDSIADRLDAGRTGVFGVSLVTGGDRTFPLVPGAAPGPPEHILRLERPLGASGWTLEATADRDAAMAPLHGLLRRFLRIGGLVLLAMAVVASFPVHFILRPLGMLRGAARRIAEGDLGARVEIDSRDEIGEVAVAFNDMAAALVERNRRLEEAAKRLARREEDVRFERDRLDGVIRSMYDGLFILDPKGRITLANAAARPLVKSLESGRRMERLVCGGPHSERESCLACLSDLSRPHQMCVMEVDGRVHEIHATTLPGREDAVAGRIFVSRDITDRMAEADRQAHQERLSVLGEITAVIAHELSNPLAAIAMFGQMLEAGLAEDSPLREHAEVIRRNAEIGKRTIRGLLDMAASPTAQAEPFDVHETLDDALRLLRPIWQRAGIDVRLVAGAKRSAITGDEAQLRPAIVNLVMNAIQAVEGPGGTVTIETFDEDDEFGVRVIDDGPGVPAEVRDRIFDPFFTTKPPGVGTGLGLPTARRVAEAHGGRLTLAGSEPRRTEFRLVLPRSRKDRPIPVWRGREAPRGE